jgi:hypothetical protein
VRAFVIAGSITLLALPFLWPYFSLGTTRPLVPKLGLKPADIVTPSFGRYLYGGLDANAATRPARLEHTFFPGFGVLALGAIGLAVIVAITVNRRRRRTERRPSASRAPSRLSGSSTSGSSWPPARSRSCSRSARRWRA